MATVVLPETRGGETSKAYTAFLDYCRMGAGRSLEKLRQKYAEPAPDEPPTRHLTTLKKWSTTHGWQERVEEYDLHIKAQEAEELEAAKIDVQLSEYRDYVRELGEWDRRFNVLMTAPGAMDVFEFTALVKLRKEIADQGRRAVGLPDKVQRVQSEISGKDGGPVETTIRVVYEDKAPDLDPMTGDSE